MSFEKKSKLDQLLDDVTYIKEKVILIEDKIIQLILALAGELKTTSAPKKKEEEKEGLVIEHEGRIYSKFVPCKYKCGLLSSWADDYKKGDKKLHYNPIDGKIKENCPKYE